VGGWGWDVRETPIDEVPVYVRTARWESLRSVFERY
jgi:hypothetical protein